MNILDKRFKYTPSAATNISETFKRERKRLADQLRKAAEERESNVTELDLRRQAVKRQMG